MSLSPSSRRSVRRPNAGNNYAANVPGTQPPSPATQFVPPSMLIPQIPVVDTIDWLPPTPRIPLRELPALPLPPQPLFRLHPTLTAVMFHWDVQLGPGPAELTPLALLLPAFESPPNVKSFRLHFSPLAGAPAMDYSVDIAVPMRAPPGTPITIGRVFRTIHRGVHAALGPTALPHGDPLRQLAEQALLRRTAGRADVLRNVDLHVAGGQSQAGSPSLGGLYFHGIAVDSEQAEGAYPVFRVVLRDYPPFP
ncbi:hypothetical protein V8D89_002831 [Ganoderma adspersum]